MDAKQLQRLSFDLARYLDDVLPDLGRHGRRSWAELYLRGLLLDGRRKSAGAMAERLQRIDRSPQDYEQSLQQFLSQSPWDERPVRDQLAQHLCRALGGEGLLILDDTGFPKQGTHSVGVVERVLSGGHSVPGFWKSVAVMMIVTLITAVAHLIQIALWALVYLLCGEMATFETAFYFSAQNYTALGYGDVVLSQRWRLLGPLEAINGLLLFGLSTAVMFAVLSRLITNRLRHQHGHWSEGQESLSGNQDHES